MSDYKTMSLAEMADLARASNPELGASGNTLFNYYTGRINATFEDHEGEGAEDTALFLASAREIVLELIRRVQAASPALP